MSPLSNGVIDPAVVSLRRVARRSVRCPVRDLPARLLAPAAGLLALGGGQQARALASRDAADAVLAPADGVDRLGHGLGGLARLLGGQLGQAFLTLARAFDAALLLLAHLGHDDVLPDDD